MSKNTVRLWVRRFKREDNDGCIDRRSGPNFIPHKISKTLEKQVVKYRNIVFCYGAKRLKYFFNLSISIGAIHRILKDYGLVKRKRRKHQKKNDLREIKSKYLSFEKLQMDVKYLTDIPPYWEQMMKMGLPKYQYTIRDVKSGMLFLGYANEISTENAINMLKWVLGKIRRYYSKEITIQTDNGVEFSGTTRYFENNYFTQAVQSYKAYHKYIPPGLCNANADVESIHATIEEEFFNLTKFSSRKDFIAKSESYRQFYNLVRPNFSKKGRTPWLIAQEDHPKSDLATFIEFINVIDLNNVNRVNSGGQTLPVLPVFPE